MMLRFLYSTWLLAVSAAAADGAGETIPLFNGRDLTGFTFTLGESSVDPASVWSVRDGVIHCTGTPVGYMRTEQEYKNYRLRYEWRWPGATGNNGVLLHVQLPDKVWPKSIEGQGEHGHAGDIWVIEGATFKEHTDKEMRRVPKLQPSSEKPVGEWNEYVIECKGDRIELRVNGVVQNIATECTVTSGYIAWQSEGAPIEFRNITLTPLGE